MPTRANAIGRYDGLAPELQDTLRRNGMQARLVQRDGDVLLAVQGHDSPLLTYPLSQSHLKAELLKPQGLRCLRGGGGSGLPPA